MKRTSIFEDSLVGSSAEWPFSVFVSKNDRTGRYTLYVHFTDPENRSYLVNSFIDAVDLRGLLEEAFLNPETIANALKESQNSELENLGSSLLAEISEESEGS